MKPPEYTHCLASGVSLAAAHTFVEGEVFWLVLEGERASHTKVGMVVR